MGDISVVLLAQKNIIININSNNWMDFRYHKYFIDIYAKLIPHSDIGHMQRKNSVPETRVEPRESNHCLTGPYGYFSICEKRTV